MSNLDQMAVITILADHPLTRTLRANGFSDDDLSAMYVDSTHEYPFPLRSYPDLCFTNSEAFRYCHMFATLKWLTTDLPWSPDRDAAWNVLALHEVEPELAATRRHSEAQSRRASHPRGKLTEDGETLASIIEKLARLYSDEYPKEIWPHLWSKLEALGLCPEEQLSARGNVQLEYGEPEGARKRKTLTLRRFGMLISAERKKMSR